MPQQGVSNLTPEELQGAMHAAAYAAIDMLPSGTMVALVVRDVNDDAKTQQAIVIGNAPDADLAAALMEAARRLAGRIASSTN